MDNIKVWSTCMLILLFFVTFSYSAQVLKAVPEKIELGTFNTFQIKETTVKLRNTGRKTFQIDKIKADCACIRTSIGANEILPGKTVELKIAARERIGGKFSHDVLIIPKDKERYEPLKIPATGTVVQPVSAKIGLEGDEVMEFDPNEPVRLGFKHKISVVKPVVYIIGDEKYFNLRESAPDVNSMHFELQNYKIEKTTASDQKDSANPRKDVLILYLKSKKMLKIGTLRELLRIKLADNIGIEIPIILQIVGDAYSQEKIIHLGNLSDSTSKKFVIHFANNVKVWPVLKWDASGYLSDAIMVTEDGSERTNSSIGITLDADKLKLSNIPDGYVFCRVKFFQDQPTDEDVVNILIDGFNTKSEK